MFQILNHNGSALVSFDNYPIGSKHVEVLMQDDHIEATFSLAEYIALPAGSYVMVDSTKYTLREPYTPNQKDELEYSYSPRFESPVMLLSGKPLFLYTELTTGLLREPDWSLTDFITNHIACILRAIKEETGAVYTAEIDNTLSEIKTISYQSLDILSGLNAICSAYGCEWCFRSGRFHIGNTSLGTSVTLTVGTNVGAPSVTQAREGYANRFYAFGSTRNILQNAYNGTNVNNLVNKRLTLNPADYPGGYKDMSVTGEEVFSTILVFDDIYPHSSLKLANVRHRDMYRLDGNEQKVVIGKDDDGQDIYDMYSIWYFTLKNGDGTPFVFDSRLHDEDNTEISGSKGMLLPNLNLSVHFSSGALNGREFELHYYDNDKTYQTTADVSAFTAHAGDFEIIFVEEGGIILPSLTGQGLIPVANDQATLFNIYMPQSYVETAYDELEEALDKEIERRSKDMNHYTVKSYPSVFSTSNPGLYLGRKVRFVNGTRTLDTRVTALTTMLDFPIEQEVTVGNDTIKGNTQQLRSEVVSANQNIAMLSSLQDLAKSIQATLNKTQQEAIANMGEFSRWFTPHYDENGVLVSLECNTALWTEMWLSAFGPSSTEGGEGGASILAELLDVIASSTNPELVKGLTGDPETDNGKVLTYSSEDDGWVAAEGGQGGGSDKNYVHVQGTSAKIWSVQHNLGKYPSVTIVDASGNEIIGDVRHNSTNDLTVTFLTAQSGKVFCN